MLPLNLRKGCSSCWLPQAEWCHDMHISMLVVPWMPSSGLSVCIIMPPFFLLRGIPAPPDLQPEKEAWDELKELQDERDNKNWLFYC